MTFICSGESVGSTRIETLPSSSLSSRSLICRDVTNCPSRPANGEVLTPKIVETVGSSIAIVGDRHGRLGVRDRLADHDVLDAGEADDVAGCGRLDVDPPQAVEREQFCDLRAMNVAVELADGNRVAHSDARR